MDRQPCPEVRRRRRHRRPQPHRRCRFRLAVLPLMAIFCSALPELSVHHLFSPPMMNDMESM